MSFVPQVPSHGFRQYFLQSLHLDREDLDFLTQALRSSNLEILRSSVLTRVKITLLDINNEINKSLSLQTMAMNLNNYKKALMKILQEWNKNKRGRSFSKTYLVNISILIFLERGMKNKPIVTEKIDFVQDIKKLRSAQIHVNQTIKRIHDQISQNIDHTTLNQQQLQQQQQHHQQHNFQESFEEPPIKVIKSRINSQGGSTKNLQSKQSAREYSDMMFNSISKHDGDYQKMKVKQGLSSLIYDEGISSKKQMIVTDLYPNHIPQIPSSQNDLTQDLTQECIAVVENIGEQLQPSRSHNQIRGVRQDIMTHHRMQSLEYREDKLLKYDAVKEEDSVNHQDSQLMSLNDMRRNQHSSPSNQNLHQQQSKINVCSPDLQNVDYTDIIKLQRPLLGSKVKYTSNLHKKLVQDQRSNKDPSNFKLSSLQFQNVQCKSGMIQFQIVRNDLQQQNCRSPSVIEVGCLQDVQHAIEKIKEGKAANSFGIRRRSNQQSRFSQKRDSHISMKSALSKTYGPINNLINSSQLIIKSPKNERHTLNQTMINNDVTIGLNNNDYQHDRSPLIQDYRERLNQSVHDTISIEREEGKPSKVQIQLDAKKNILDGTLLLQATIHKTSGNTPQSVTFTKKLFSPKETQRVHERFNSIDVSNINEEQQKVTIQIDKQSCHTNTLQVKESNRHSSPQPQINKDNSKKTYRSDKKEQQSQRSLNRKKRQRKQIFNKNKNAVQNALVEQDSLDNDLQKVDIILPDYKTVNMQPQYAEKKEIISPKQPITAKKYQAPLQQIQQQQQQHNQSRINQSFDKTENSKLYRTYMDPNKKTFQENLDHLLKELNQSASEFHSQRQRSNSKGDCTPNILYSNKDQLYKQYESSALHVSNKKGGMKQSFWIKDNLNYMKDYQEAEYNSITHKPGTINTSDFGLSLGIDINTYSRAKTSNLNKRGGQNSKCSNSLQNTRKNIEFKILKVKINQNTVQGDRSMFEIDLNQHFKLKSNFQKDIYNKQRINSLSKQSSKTRVQSPNQNEISLLKALRESSPSQILDIFSNSIKPLSQEQWKQIPQNSIKFTLNKNEVYSPNIIPIADHLRSVKKYTLNQKFFGNRNQNTEVQQFNKSIMEIIGQQKPCNKKDQNLTLLNSQSPKSKNQNRKLLHQSGGHRKNNYSLNNKVSGWNGQTHQSMEFKTPLSTISQIKGYQTMTNHLRQSNRSGGFGNAGTAGGFYQQEGSSKKLSSFNQDIMGILQDEQSNIQLDNNIYLKQPRFNIMNQSQTGIRVSQTSHLRQRSSVLFKHQGQEANQLRQSDKISDVVDALSHDKKLSLLSNDLIM